MRITIKDVARHADVSTATVSNVLTGAKFVSNELKLRIAGAMDELGYQPNVIARSLKINKTMRIGVIVPDITNPFFSEIVKMIDAKVNEEDFQLIVCNSEYDIEKEKKLFNSFVLSGGVDGLVMVAPRMEVEAFNIHRMIPLIIVDRPQFQHDMKDVTFIYADNYIGASYMASHFLEKEYKEFACIAGPETVPNANARYEGFVHTLSKNGIPERNITVLRGEFTFDCGYASMMKILANYDPKRERKAVFVCSDIVAWGAIEAAKAKALAIPEDIGIAGYDNIYFSNFIHQGLTTVENPSVQMGEKVGAIMLDRLQRGVAMSKKPIILDSSLIVRRTV